MAIIQVNSADLREGSTQLTNLSGQFYSNESEIVEIVNTQVRPNWEGNAADAFYDQFVRLNKSLDEYKLVIDQYAAFLSTAAEEYDSAENQNQSKTDTLNNNLFA